MLKIKPLRHLLVFLGMVLATTIVMQGCIAHFSGYVPIGPDTAERRYCAAGIKDGFRRRTDSGVEVLLWAGENQRQKQIRLDADLYIPEGITVQVLSPEFIFQSDEWNSPRTLAVYEITTSGPKHYKPSTELSGAAGSLGRYSFQFFKDKSGETGIPKANSFVLQFPLLLINGKTYHLAPVTFEAYTKWSVYMCA